VFLPNKPGHAAWVNSAALRAAHITAATPDPPDARIERDSHGEPTGILHETNAQELVTKDMPPPSLDDRVADLQAALSVMTHLGITSIMDAMVTPQIAQTYQELQRRDMLDVRANLCLLFNP